MALQQRNGSSIPKVTEHFKGLIKHEHTGSLYTNLGYSTHIVYSMNGKPLESRISALLKAAQLHRGNLDSNVHRSSNRMLDHCIICMHTSEKASLNGIVFILLNTTTLTCCCSSGTPLFETSQCFSLPPSSYYIMQSRLKRAM